VKQLRLQEARRLMLGEDFNAASEAYREESSWTRLAELLLSTDSPYYISLWKITSSAPSIIWSANGAAFNGVLDVFC
jgi:hypothetical protein